MSLSSPLVSIVIPFFNNGVTLKTTLHSISTQTYRPIEVVVVDDGSTKRVDHIPYGVEDVRGVKMLRQEHRGAGAARNYGFRESKGEYVFFCDADVVAEPTLIEKLLTKLHDHPEASYAYCNFRYGYKSMPGAEFDPERLRRINYISTMSLVRRADFPGFDEALSRFQDWDLWLTMLQERKVGVWVPEYLFHVHTQAGLMSQWLPAFAYGMPWRWFPGIRHRVRKYEAARDRIRQKHHLM